MILMIFKHFLHLGLHFTPAVALLLLSNTKRAIEEYLVIAAVRFIMENVCV